MNNIIIVWGGGGGAGIVANPRSSVLPGHTFLSPSRSCKRPLIIPEEKPYQAHCHTALTKHTGTARRVLDMASVYNAAPACTGESVITGLDWTGLDWTGI